MVSHSVHEKEEVDRWSCNDLDSYPLAVFFPLGSFGSTLIN